MTIRKRCNEGSCTNGRKCLEHLRFDVMWRGKRYRMPANDFAIPRMDPGKQRPIQSMEEARDWERVFIGEVKAGRDPSRTPTRSTQVNTQITTVAAFLDAYLDRCVKPAGLRSIGSVRSQIAVLKEHLGNIPLSGLEDPDEINRFKTDSEYAEDVEIASVHRVLERLRAAMNWGMAQTPPLFTKSPFHRFGVRLNKKAEIVRDRREQLQRIDLRWHDLRHEGACRLHADGVDIRIIQLMLGHASIQQTQRYLNVTDEEPRTTASAGDGQLMRCRMFARLSRICPGGREKLARRTGRFPQLAHPRSCINRPSFG
jgi:integrase-like protein